MVMRLLLLALVISNPAPGQPVSTLLESPTATLSHDFTSITQVFELRDGRVVVLDRDDASIWLCNFRANSTRMIGREGAGPGEYRRPAWLLPLGGDSVGVYDDAAVRILALSPGGDPKGFLQLWSPSPGVGRVAARRGDETGWLYGEGSASAVSRNGSIQRADSAPIFRWRPGSDDIQLMTHVGRALPHGAITSGGGSGAIVPGSFAQPETRNLWTVGADGRIAEVSHEPYFVRFISPNRSLVTGTQLPHDPTPVSDSVKQAYLAEIVARGGMQTGIAVSSSGIATPTSRRRPSIDAASITWKTQLPPFRADAFVGFAPNGVLWIQRTTFGREAGRYDLVGPRGELLKRVHLRPGERVVGFGRNSIYVILTDQDDLKHLQRHSLPR